MSEACFDVALLPEQLLKRKLGDVVVIDVLRASTTAASALDAGARRIIPCESVEEARQTADQLRAAGEAVLTGGERGGRRIDGFDLGNSPLDYRPEAVAGRTVVFTTTNGTRALRSIGDAERVLFGAATNIREVVTALSDTSDLTAVCSGTDGAVTREDVVVAGWLLQLIASMRAAAGRPAPSWSDSASLARDAAAACGLPNETPEPSDEPLPALLSVLRDSQGGRNLHALGMDADVSAAATLGRWRCVPQYEAAAGRMVSFDATAASSNDG